MTNVQQLVQSFDDLLDRTMQEVWATEDLSVCVTQLSIQLTPLGEAAVHTGDHCFQMLEDGKLTPSEELHCYLIDFSWSDQVKSFFVLWRDVLFQLQKARIMRLESNISAFASREIVKQSKDVLWKAADQLKRSLPEALKAIQQKRKGGEKNIARWKLQQNPWPVYKEQLHQLTEQCGLLSEQHHQLESLVGEFNQLKKLIRAELNWCKNEVATTKENARKASSFITENIKDKPGRIASHLEDLESKINIRSHLNDFTDNSERTLDKLPEKMQVPVSTENGVILFKEINFKKATRQWVESEILPLFYETWELTDSICYGMKMSLVNSRNRAIIAASEDKDGGGVGLSEEDATQPLNLFLDQVQMINKNLEQLEVTVKERLRHDFDVSNVYSLGAEFLPVPLEYSINQFGLDRHQLIKRAKNWLRRITGRVQQIKTSVEREEIVSTSEKVVRYIQSRKGDAHNNHYTSIFLTKGYLGESFWVGRENEIRHMEKVIDQWNAGYRGAVLLSGNRYCGKTLFGELIANRFFHENTIRVEPNSVLNIQGRKMDTGYDLGKALEFVRKHTLHNRSLVWLDDLEQWNGNGYSLYTNVKQLRKYLDNHSTQLFFMVSTCNWMKAHLDRVFEIGKIFQTEIILDRMSQHEVRQAVLIRHGATHQTLINEDGEEVNSSEFRKLFSRIYKSAGGNIGDALNQWAYAAHSVDEEKVIHKTRTTFSLPDFTNSDIAVLMAAIMMEKRTTEYRLRKMFGPAFQYKYGNVLKRLLSIGLLTRQIDGWLEINEVAVNDVGRLLERKNYLKFSD